MKYSADLHVTLRKNPYPGHYIAVEGIDGSGKSTQIEMLKKYLEDRGKTVVLTYEPRNDIFLGDIIRDILQKKMAVPSATLQYLYSANRITNHEEIVYPALKQGQVVISHRCFWSAIPYGFVDVDTTAMKQPASTRGEQAARVMAIHGIMAGFHHFIAPDRTFYLDLSIETAMERLHTRGKKIEFYERQEKLLRVLKGYEWLLQQFPKAFAKIDAEQSVDEVAKSIRTKVVRYLDRK